jgi:hypothetical protein
MVRLGFLCPIHAAITATGTPCRCIRVAQACLSRCVQFDVPQPRRLDGITPVAR